MRAHFTLVSAFTTDVYAGNPAAVIFLDPYLPLDVLGKVARNFNQPATSIVSPTSSDTTTSENDRTIVRQIRFMLGYGKEVPICGHATLAAAKVLFTELGENVDTIQFRCVSGSTLVAIRHEGGFIELEFPSGVPENVGNDEVNRLTPLVNNAFGREVLIRSIKRGGPGVYHRYLIVEVDERENIGGSNIDPKALADTGYVINAITTCATNTEDLFVSRVFSPMLLEGEDWVCGSAHCLLTPYWCEKRGVTPGEQINAKQVSPRGGDIRAVWDGDKGTVKLRGQATIFASGQILLPHA